MPVAAIRGDADVCTRERFLDVTFVGAAAPARMVSSRKLAPQARRTRSRARTDRRRQAPWWRRARVALPRRVGGCRASDPATHRRLESMFKVGRMRTVDHVVGRAAVGLRVDSQDRLPHPFAGREITSVFEREEITTGIRAFRAARAMRWPPSLLSGSARTRDPPR